MSYEPISKDTGCEFAPSCLNCPFPECLEEIPGGALKKRLEVRNSAIRQLYQEGKKVKELAEMFKVGVRTIQRVLYGR